MSPASWVETGCWLGILLLEVVGIRPLKNVFYLFVAPVPEPISKKPRGQRCKGALWGGPVRKKEADL